MDISKTFFKLYFERFLNPRLNEEDNYILNSNIDNKTHKKTIKRLKKMAKKPVDKSAFTYLDFENDEEIDNKIYPADCSYCSNLKTYGEAESNTHYECEKYKVHWEENELPLYAIDREGLEVLPCHYFIIDEDEKEEYLEYIKSLGLEIIDEK